MNKLGKPSLFKASLLAALLAATGGAHAAGLGKLTVYSAIGQPLSAEVAITATSEELASLSAKLASHDAFKEAGIELMPALAGLRFSVAKLPNSQSVLRVTTDRPLNEPFLHFLVELNWTAGRMVREYTFLLDPPEMLQTAKPSVVAPVAPVVLAAPSAPAPAPVLQGLPAPLKIAPPPQMQSAPDLVTTTKKGSPAPAAMPAEPPPAATAGERQVKAGDTLSKIARENMPAAVSLDQMLVALFNSNRDAFDGNNMNRLRAGKILRLPDPAEAAKVDTSEAHRQVVAQSADFNTYRRRLADAVGMAPAADVAPKQQTTGKIKPQVEGNVPPAPAKDKLEVSRTEAAKSAKAGGKGNLEEDLIVREKALREASDRIVQLEKNIESLKHLVELKSQAGAQVQQQAQTAASPKPAEVKQPEPAPMAKSVEPARAVPAPIPAPAAVPPVAAVKTVEPARPAESVPPPAPTPAPTTPEAAKPAEPAASAPPAAPPSPPKPAPKKPAPPSPPPPETGFSEENPEIVFGGGGLIALLLGYFGYSAWRKKQQAREDAEFAEEPGISASDLASKSGAVFGAASESVDNGEISIQGDFSEGGVLTTEESVDPVAEADVYMAYGRDGQAEEILLEGLKADPTRSAIHLKLLELYANRKDAGQFEVIAKQLHDLNDGQGADWGRAVALASGMGLAGGLFAAAVAPALASAEEMPAAAVVAAVPEVFAEEVSTATAVTTSSALAQEATNTLPPAAAAGQDSSLDFDLDLGTSAAAPAAGMEEASQPSQPKSAAEEAMSLDFDFDLGAPEPAESPVPVVAEPSGVDSNVIDFSFDMDTPAAEPVVAAASVAALPPVDDGNGMDFDLDLGSSGHAEAAEVAEVAEVVPAAIDIDMAEAGIDFPADMSEASAPAPDQAPVGGLSELKLDFDLELDAAAPASTGDAMPAALDLADIGLDLSEPAEPARASNEISFDVASLPEIELPSPAAAPMPAQVPATDSDFDLTLDVGEVEPVELETPPLAEMAVELPDIDFSSDLTAPVPVAPVANEAEPLAPLPDLNLDADVGPAAGQGGVVAAANSAPDDPEVATKLELAQAYEEMGDREGARELLNEVLTEGSSAQQGLARARLDQLDV